MNRRLDDTWTVIHDLALLYVALAYGTDHRLSEHELETITTSLNGWFAEATREEVHEVVMEAMAILLEEEAEREVVRSMQTLRHALPLDKRQQALEEFVRIAEADGVLLSNERSLISLLAEVWEIKKTGRDLLAQTSVEVEEQPAWSLLHDLALIYVVLAHSTDNELSDPEIHAILQRLRDWQVDLETDEVRRVMREALQFYATGPDEASLRRSVFSIRDYLPLVQRMAVLDDLFFIGEADGVLHEEEKKMITSLAQAWEVSVRFNGHATA